MRDGEPEALWQCWPQTSHHLAGLEASGHTNPPSTHQMLASDSPNCPALPLHPLIPLSALAPREAPSRTASPSAVWSCRRAATRSLASSWCCRRARASTGVSPMSCGAWPPDPGSGPCLPHCYCVAPAATLPAVCVGLFEVWGTRLVAPPKRAFYFLFNFHGVSRKMLKGG